MQTIPPTRTLDAYRRVNVPADVLSEYGEPTAVDVSLNGGDVVLHPASGDPARALSEKNRVRLPPNVASHYDEGEEFVVIGDEDRIVLRPTDNIDITI